MTRSRCWLNIVVVGGALLMGATAAAETFKANIFSAVWSKKCVGIFGASKEAGTDVVQWKCNKSQDQTFQFVPVGKRFQILPLHAPGLCLSATNFDGIFYVQQKKCLRQANFLWSLVGEGNKKRLALTIGGGTKCLAIEDGGKDNGTYLIVGKCNTKAKPQQFQLLKTPQKQKAAPKQPKKKPQLRRRSGPSLPPLKSIWRGPFVQPQSIIAASAANLQDGKILMWSSAFKTDFTLESRGKTWTTIFDPKTKQYTSALIQNTQHDMFCPGTAILGDGRVMITGGTSDRETSFYDPRNNKFSIGPKMLTPRGYHSMTVLSDGTIFTLGGSWSGGIGGKHGELFIPRTNSWKSLPGVNVNRFVTAETTDGQYRSDNHMWLQQAPNGYIYHAGPATLTHWIDPRGKGKVYNSVKRGDDLDAMNGNAVLYDIGKLLTVGGAPEYNNSMASARTYIIDISGQKRLDVTVERVGDMAFPRAMHNSVVLPDGDVVVVGGQEYSEIFTDNRATNVAEIWNAGTKQWRKLLPAMKVPRTYHSVALLLKDGRVLSSGGGLCGEYCGDANHPDAEILVPPYLQNGDKRPRILALSTNKLLLGGSIVIVMDGGSDHTFSIIRTSAVTHSVNNDQRRIPLRIGWKFNRGNNAVYIVRIPFNKHIVIPGTYFLFAMNSKGTPSIARTVKRQYKGKK